MRNLIVLALLCGACFGQTPKAAPNAHVQTPMVVCLLDGYETVALDKDKCHKLGGSWVRDFVAEAKAQQVPVPPVKQETPTVPPPGTNGAGYADFLSAGNYLTFAESDWPEPEGTISSGKVEGSRIIYTLDLKKDWTCYPTENFSERPTIITLVCIKDVPKPVPTGKDANDKQK
jgi:hypothetical protein